MKSSLTPVSSFALAACLGLAAAPAVAASPNCAALTSSPIFQVINPGTGANLLTASQNEANNAARVYGYTDNRGTPFHASAASADGLVGAHRMYNKKSNDFFWTTNANEITSAVQKYGYEDQGIYFYVSATAASCTQPVYRFLLNNIHRFAVSQADRDALTASGWTPEGVMFYGGVNSFDPPDETEGAGDAPIGSPCPAGATLVNPTMSTDDIQKQINTGATICFTPGRYRLTKALSPKQGQVLHGEEGAVLTGAVELKAWAADGAAWRADNVTLPSLGWPGVNKDTGSQDGYKDFCEDNVNHPCTYAENIFYDGAPLQRVTARADVVPGTFFTDYPNRAVYIGSRPAGHSVELATANAAVRVAANGVTIKGLTVEMFAQLADRGEIEINSDITGTTIQNCEVRYAHGAGVLAVGSKAQIQYNRIHDNGQLGVAISNGNSNSTVNHNDLIHNNIDGFWTIDGSAGGIKVNFATHAKVTHNLVRGNLNHGIWFDEGANHAIVTNNIVDNNYSAGILFEVSTDAQIIDNVVTNNGLMDSQGRKHNGNDGSCPVPGPNNKPSCSGGIQIADGDVVTIAGNTLAGNVHGISIVQSSRNPRNNNYTIPNTQNVKVHDNVITLGDGELNGLVFQGGPAGFNPYTAGNEFTHNTYHLPSPGANAFFWQNTAVNSTKWQQTYKQDIDGTFLSP